MTRSAGRRHREGGGGSGHRGSPDPPGDGRAGRGARRTRLSAAQTRGSPFLRRGRLGCTPVHLPVPTPSERTRRDSRGKQGGREREGERHPRKENGVPAAPVPSAGHSAVRSVSSGTAWGRSLRSARCPEPAPPRVSPLPLPRDDVRAAARPLMLGNAPGGARAPQRPPPGATCQPRSLDAPPGD